MRRKLVNRKVVNSIGIGILAAMTAATPVMAQAQEPAGSDLGNTDVADENVTEDVTQDNTGSTDFQSEAGGKLEEAAGAIDAAQEGVKDNEEIQTDLTGTETNVGALQDKVDAFDTANNAADKALDEFESAVADDENKTLETMEENVSQAKDTIEGLDSSVQSNVAEAEKQADIAETLQGQEYTDSAAAEAAKNQAQAAKDAAQAEYDSAVEADKKAQEELDNAQASLDVLKDQKEKADQARDAAQEAVDKAQEALEALLADYRAEGEYVGNSAEAINAAKAALEKAKKDLGKAEGDILDIDKEIEEKKAEVATAEQSKNEAEQKLKDAETGKKEADSIVSDKDNSLKAAEEKIKNAQTESEAADKAVQDARDEMKNAAIEAMTDAQDKYKEEKKALENAVEVAESAQKNLADAQEAFEKAGGENWDKLEATKECLEQNVVPPEYTLLDYAMAKQGKELQSVGGGKESTRWIVYTENGESKGGYYDFKEVDDKIVISQMETVFQDEDGHVLTFRPIGTGGEELYAHIDGTYAGKFKKLPTSPGMPDCYEVDGRKFEAKPQKDNEKSYYSQKEFDEEYEKAVNDRNAAEAEVEKAEEAKKQADREKEEQQKKHDKAFDYMNALTGAANFIMNQKGDENADIIEKLIEDVYRAGGTEPKAIIDNIIAKKQNADNVQADADAKKEALGLTQKEMDSLIQKIEAAENVINQYLKLEAEYAEKEQIYTDISGALTKAFNYKFVETAHNKVVEAINTLADLRVQSMDEAAYEELMNKIGEAVNNYDAALRLKDSIEAKVDAALQAFNRAAAAADADFIYRLPATDNSSASGTTDNEEAEETPSTEDGGAEVATGTDAVVIPLTTAPTGTVTAIPDAQVPAVATALTADADTANAGTVMTLARGGAGNGVVQADAGEEELTAESEEEEVITVADEEVPLASVDLEADDEDSLIVADEEVPLTYLELEEEKNQMSWWWLLIIAICGATGYEMYRRHKKNLQQEEK